jgi:DNA-binding NarL/FixJ family response regulator
VTGRRLPTVLLVDDVPEVRTMVRTALRVHGGFEVVGEASRGVAAVTLTGELRPDIVVLDLGLPDISGRDVLTRIAETVPETMVVIFSGVDPGERSWFEERSAGYVLKDADVQYLVELLENLVAPPERRASIHLPQDLSGVREARRFVAETLAEWHLDELTDEASIVVTELAANAVLHARSEYDVQVLVTPHALRIEVCDQGTGSPEPQPPTAGSESGRGLHMVSSLCAAWGVDHPVDGGKVVWSELVRAGSTAAASS